MLDILTVVLPVFLVTGAGYLAAWRGLFAASAVDGLMVFTQKFAIPCLLFTGVATLDLGADFDPALLLSFTPGRP
jgi:malonate transporter